MCREWTWGRECCAAFAEAGEKTGLSVGTAHAQLLLRAAHAIMSSVFQHGRPAVGCAPASRCTPWLHCLGPFMCEAGASATVKFTHARASYGLEDSNVRKSLECILASSMLHTPVPVKLSAAVMKQPHVGHLHWVGDVDPQCCFSAASQQISHGIDS